MSPQMPEQSPAAPGATDISNEDLLKLITKPLDDVLTRYVDQEVDVEKQWQLLRLDKCDKYIRGIQFLALSGEGGYAQWRGVGPQTQPDYEDSTGINDYNLDIVDSYRKKYIATLGLRPFYNAVAVPDDPQSEIDRKAARQANLCAVWMRNKWNLRVKNITMFDLQYRGGTVYPYNPFIADKQTFGEIEVEQFTISMVEEPAPPDPLTGAPMPPTQVPSIEPAPPKKFPASGPDCQLYDGSMVTVPFTCRDFRKIPWLLLEKEENRGTLLQMYGKALRDKTNDQGEMQSQGDTAAQTEGKRVRSAETSLTGIYRPGNNSAWTHSRYWLSTAMYEFFPEQNTRDVAYEKFPNGMKVSQVEGATIRIEDEDVHAVWGCIPPLPGNTIYQDPICWSILGNQDIVNFLANIAVAREERGLPTAVVDAELIDSEELSSRRFLPNELIAAKASFGGSLRESMVALPTPNKDDGAAANLYGLVLTNTESELGLLPPVWGGQSKQETASGQRMEISQGLMQLGVQGEMVSQGYSDMYMRGCKLIEQYSPDGFVVADPEGTTSEMVDIEAMRAGKYHFESDPNMPMTNAELGERAMGIIQESPMVAEAIGWTGPLAAATLRDVILPGFPQVPSPLQDTRDKVQDRIQILLTQQPVPGPPSPDGQSGPLMPSLMPEEYVDNYADHAALTREWLNSAPGRKINPFLGGDPSNMPGYQNVVAYGLLCEQKSLPPPAPPAPPKPLTVSAKASDFIIPGVPETLSALGFIGAPPQSPPDQSGNGAPPLQGQPMNAPPPPPINAAPEGPMGPPTTIQ